MSRKTEIAQKQTINADQLRNDVLGFIMDGYYDSHCDCSAAAASFYFQRVIAKRIAQKHLQEASDEQIIEDQAKIHKCMIDLYNDFEGNHHDAKKIIDECLDRYIPGLRECREQEKLPMEHKTELIPEQA